jgi:N,N'-diacetylbacillosaminyl-diphospho-undecaprenol alpha-1,3-N-acetylgalactosaminyltransferase
VISNGFNGFLFRTGSSPDLAAKMNMLLSDETLRKSLGQNSRRIAEKAYDWHAIAKKLMEIYKRLLDYD